MLQRLDIEETIMTCYQRPPNTQNLKSDIYDGRVWQTLDDGEGNQFFSSNTSDGRLGFSLNVDWFQPHKHIPTSVGAIYLTLLNLPRHIRYLKHNIILVGVIPGPSEPSVTEIHHYLEPMVHELELLWKGVTIKTTTYPQGRLFRGALILIACDTPAARKVFICLN